MEMGGASGVTKIGKLFYTSCALGQSAKAGGCDGTATEYDTGDILPAANVCSKLNLDNRKWRMPSYTEGLKIKGTSVAKNAPKNTAGFFWTDTMNVDGHSDEDTWWVIDYNSWEPQANFARPGYAICVSAEQ